MSLVTVLRSPSTSDSTSLGDSEIDEDQEDSSVNRSRAMGYWYTQLKTSMCLLLLLTQRRSSFEGFFASKGAAYALPDGDFARRATKHGGEMQLHLQAMVNLLRDEDVLRLVVKLESQYPNRIRYLTIVSAFGPDEEEQSIIMGVDWTERATIGLVVPLYRDTVIKLDGDGGFKMTSAGTAIIFKPISVQTMWTALQWIHKCTDIARRNNYFFPNGSSHAWVEYYYRKISSDRMCLNEWHQMEDLLSKRPESPIGTSPEKELIMKLIRHKLREVMMKVDLEEVTSRQVRTMLEADTQMDLREYRSFIDEEMFTILGQMDSASKIFDHVYLGSEWNASNLEELKDNGVGYILNITREIDNFFPGTFCYHNIRVYDLDETELLHHWDNTYKFIQRAKNAGSKVLVHCRMGISRSASTVIAYGMKEYGWSLGDTMKYVKARRSVVQPNAGFWKQLITYEGILNSSKHRYNKLFTTEASDIGAAREKKKPGNTANKTNEQAAQPLIQDLPIKTESVIMYQHPSEETTQASGVIWVTTEGIDDTLLASEALLENRDGDPVMMASSPVNSTTDSGQDLMGETAGSRDLEIAGIDKTALYRVSSVPTLPSGDKMRQPSNAEINGHFQRSSSLRERGRRNVENLDAYKAASDENITEFGLKQKETSESSADNFCIKDVELQQSKFIEKESIVENPSCDGTEMEHQDRGSLPGELHGVLESGFVKRCSRNFEEGVCNVPSVFPVLEGSTSLEEVDVACAADESFELSTALRESTSSEEPGPGVVKKHKEEYELKHRQSLKRGAVLQRSGSGDRGSLKRERGEILGDHCDSKAEEGWEDDHESAVTVDALVQKVNEDMKKEVSVRRISKKGVELRAFVRAAGEQMEDAATDGHQRNLKQALDNCVIDKGYQGSTGESFSEKVNELLLEETQPTEKSAENKEISSSAVRNEGSDASAVLHSSIVHDLSAEVFRSSYDREDTISEQDKESILHKGLVKHHTLLIEERLQPLSDKHAEGEDEKEGELTVSRDGDAGLPSEGEARGLAVETLQASVAEDVNAIQEAESMEQQTRDVACERKERTSDQDDGNAPQKGLVKRHTLLMEGKLQPLEQVLVQNVENEAGEENTKSDQEKSTQPLKDETMWAGCDSAERVASVGTDAKAEGESSEKEIANEKKEACELLDDSEDRASERDIVNVLQKGLVKRHTLLIEGRLQPVCQDYDKEANWKDDPIVGANNVSALDSEQVAPDVSVEDKSPSGEIEDRTSKASDQDTELPAEKGLVKRHTLLIEARNLQPLDQGVEGEDEKLTEETIYQEICSWDLVDEQQRYQIERSNKTTPGETEEEYAHSEMVSGLVKRETLRIEERVKPAVLEASTPKQDEIEMLTCNSGTVLEADRGVEESCSEDEKNNDERGREAREQLMEQEKAEVGVDTSSVVRVKDHTQHLEGIIRITTTAKGVEKSKSQISIEDFPESRDEPPKIVLIPRWYSDDRSDQGVEPSSSEKLLEDRMEEILSESAVSVALLKAQENLNLENERFVDWDFANVKQRTRIFEEIVADVDSNRREDDRGSESPIRRCESLPKTIHPSQKYVLRRRSFSDVSETVSSSSGRKVDYTIHFSNGESSSSSSLPREWSPRHERQTREARDERKTEEVFSPEIKVKID